MRRYQAFLVLGLSLLVAGCTLPVGNATLADIEAGYSQAQDAIAHAEAMGAEEHAPDLLRLARNRLEKVRNNQSGAPSDAVLSQYRYVESLAQRAATRSVEKRVQEVSERLDEKPSPQPSAKIDTKVKSRLDSVRQQLDELSEQVRGKDQRRETRERLDTLEDTVARIGSIRDELARLGDRLKETTDRKLPQLRDRVRRNTRRLNSLCDEVRRLRSTSETAAPDHRSAYDGEGVVAYWPFDDPAPRGFREAKGRVKGRSLGARIRSGGVFGGRSLRLSGDRDFFAVAHDSKLNPGRSGGFTVSAWFRTDSLEEQAHLLNKWDPETETGWYLSVSPADVSFVVKGGTEPVRTYAGGSLVDGTWHHLAGTYHPDRGIVRLYLDGRRVDRASAEVSVVSEGFLALGGFAHKNKNFFRGSLDEVRVYSRALTDSGVKTLADTTPAVPTVCSTDSAVDSFDLTSLTKTDTAPDPSDGEGLVAHWPLDDTGETVVDVRNGLDGERLGATSDRPGVRGAAFEFDGRDDRVRLPDDPLLEGTGGFTVSAWVRPDERRRQYVVDKGPTPSPYSLFMTEDGDIAFSLSTDEGYNQIRSVGYDPDRWYYLTGTYDGSVMKLYRNGELVSTARVDGRLHSNDRSLVIGSRSGREGFFKGRIDEVKFHAEALAPAAVRSEYEGLRETAD